MNDTEYKLFLTQLKRHEGERLVAYRDTVGILTIGVGHNCESSPVNGVKDVGDRIPQELSDALFEIDTERHLRELENKLPWVTSLNAPRHAVMANLAFNMGMKTLLTFKNTLDLIKNGQYVQAGAAMLMSKWAKQVKGRAIELSKQMNSGEWQNG